MKNRAKSTNIYYAIKKTLKKHLIISDLMAVSFVKNGWTNN